MYVFMYIKKNNVYPCKPQFYYIKVGLRGSKLYRHVFVMYIILMHAAFFNCLFLSTYRHTGLDSSTLYIMYLVHCIPKLFLLSSLKKLLRICSRSKRCIEAAKAEID